MRTAIKAAFNNDALLMQWFGHGSRFRWGSISMFNIFDPAALAANDTWPVTTSYTCWTGHFINVFNNWQSMGELLLLTPQRGSVADFSPSGLHVGSALLALNQGVVQAVFHQRLDRIGQAVDAGRLYYFGQSGAFLDIIDTMVLFGDPALKLRLPSADLSASTASVSPTQADPGDSLHYIITLQNTSTFTATDVIVTADYDDAHGMVSTSTPLALNLNGKLRWTLAELPPGISQLSFDLQLGSVFPAGTTELHAPVEVRSGVQLLASLDASSHVYAAPQLGASNLGVSREWAPPAYPLTYTLTVVNTGNAPSAATWLTVTLPADLVSVTSPDLTYDPLAHRLTWQGPAPIAVPVPLTFGGVISPTLSACDPLAVTADLRDELGQMTPLTVSTGVAVPDVDCDGTVDIVDVQLVAARWGAVQGSGDYHPRYDLDGDGQISAFDVTAVATNWNQ
jgi:hypothetical protein